ncbi:hypothetical protein LTR53_002239 [Teratosphaeriaceae sp. CCFEE 6253]|nr:hypothetical protein LTR53_002239 [Teratosphaeriaceae sp. CCFEE 6253]
MANNKRKKKEARAKREARRVVELAASLVHDQQRRVERRQEHQTRLLKIADREARQQERSTKYLDPRRLNHLPARLLPRQERGCLRDYRRLPHPFRRPIPGRAAQHQDLLLRLASISAVTGFLFAGHPIVALVVTAIALATTVKTEPAQVDRIVHGPKAFKAVHAQYDRPICGFPGLPGTDTSHVQVVKDGKTIAIPIDKSPLLVFSARQVKAASRGRKPSVAASAPGPSAEDAGEASLSGRGKAVAGPEDPYHVDDVAEDSSEDDAAFVPEDLDLGQSKARGKAPKRKLTAKPKVPPKKRGRPVTSIAGPGGKKLSQPENWNDLGLDNIGITLDHITRIANRFVGFVKDGGLKPKAKARHDYTPSYEEPQHVLDLPLYDPQNRHYELIEDKVALYDHELPDGTLVRAWRLQARNLRDLAAESVNLFTLSVSIWTGTACPPCLQGQKLSHNSSLQCDRGRPACSKCTQLGKAQDCATQRAEKENKAGVNLVTETVCADRTKVIELGRLKVDIMNRAPMHLDVDRWARVYMPTSQGGVAESAERTFVDTVSFVTWKKLHHSEFDLGSLPNTVTPGKVTTHESKTWGRGVYKDPLTIKHPNKGSTVFMVRPPGIWTTNVDLHNAAIRCAVSPPDVDVAAVQAHPYLQGYHIFGPLLTDDPGETALDLEDEKIMASVKICHIIASELVGLVGTSIGFRDFIEDRRTSFITSTNVRQRRDRGSYNNTRLWNQPWREAGDGGYSLSLGSEALSNLDLSGLIPEGTAEEDLWRGRRATKLFTSILDRSCMAFVIQESINALARGETLLNAVFTAFITAQYIEHGLLVKEDILANYCTCPDAATQAATEHVFRPCAAMNQETTESGSRLVCRGCRGRSFSNPTTTLETKVKRGVWYCFYKDSKWHEPPWSQADMRERILSKHRGTDPSAWLDGYALKFLSTADALWPAASKMRVSFSHPNSLSLEKPFSRWLRADGKLSLHDVENITLIRDCVNRCKGLLPPSAVPHLKKAIQLRQRVNGRDPRQGYYPDVEDEWKILERGHDNLRMICSLTSMNSGSRIAYGQDRSRLAKTIGMEKTGIWDGVTLGPLKKLFTTRGQVQHRAKDPSGKQKHALWTKLEWTQLLACVDQIEGDTQEGGMNQYDLRIPRLGQKKIPWLWRSDTCPDDVDREYIFNEFEARLRTMDEACDKLHETHESPATMFLECVVQWFETGGKCHVFGFVMTPYVGHCATFSFGRGFQQKLMDGSCREIRPGEHMATGCTSLLPKTMATDYDTTRRTVVVESWRANALRFCYPAGKMDLLPLLEQGLLEVEDETDWYDGVKSLDAYAEVPLPSLYKDTRQWERLIKAGQSIAREEEEEGEDEEGDEDIGDDEVAFYEERLEQAKGATAEDQSSPKGEEMQEDPDLVQWTTPGTHDAIDEWQADDIAYISALPLPDDVKDELMKRTGRWMTVASQALHSDVAQLDALKGSRA